MRWSKKFWLVALPIFLAASLAVMYFGLYQNHRLEVLAQKQADLIDLQQRIIDEVFPHLDKTGPVY